MHRALFLLFIVSLWAVFPVESVRRRYSYRRRSRYPTPAYYYHSTTVTIPPTTPSTTQPYTPPAPTPFPICSREFLLFDFRTTTPAYKVKQILAPVKPLCILKVIGSCRYIVVVENTQSEELKNLELPADAKVNVRTIPIETESQFFARFNIPFVPNVVIDFPPGEQLIFVKGTWRAKGLNEAQYQASLAKFAKDILKLMGTALRNNFVSVATLPTEIWLIWKRSDCDTAEDIFKNLDPLGGPGCISSEAVRVIKL